MRLLLTCVLVFGLVLQALGSPVPDKSDGVDSSLMFGPVPGHPAPIIPGYFCSDSLCIQKNNSHNGCHDQRCSKPANNGHACGCHELPQEPPPQGQPTESGTVEPAPVPQSTGTESPLLPTSNPQLDNMICEDTLCGRTRGGSFWGYCFDPHCFKDGAEGDKCSCTDDWQYGGPGIPTSGISEASSTGSATIEEDSGSTTANTGPNVKRTREPCPSPKVNPNPPFNFICPGDED